MRAYWCGWAQPQYSGLHNVCGCGTVVISYVVHDGNVADKEEEDRPCVVNWCPRCEATWTGLEHRRLYAEGGQ